jgi:hypothetical protein
MKLRHRWGTPDRAQKKNGAGEDALAPFARRKAGRSDLSSRERSDLGTRARGERHDGHRLQFEGVIPGGNHGQGHRAIGGAVEILGFKPGAESWIVDFRLSLPEVGFEAALNAEMAELELNVVRVFWKIAANIRASNVKAGDAVAFALSFDDHKVPILRVPVSVHG